MSGFDIYWILKLDAIRDSLGVISFFVFIGTFLSGACAFAMWLNDDAKKKIFRQLRNGSCMLGVLFAVFFVLHILTPTTKQACTIYVLPKIINNEKVQKIPEKILELSNQWLDDHIDKETEGEE